MIERAQPPKLSLNGRVAIPNTHVPIFRMAIAEQMGTTGRVQFRIGGGIGDQICAEPTLRFALKHIKDCEIHLAAEHPEFFRHLTFKSVSKLEPGMEPLDKFVVFHTLLPPDESNLMQQFVSHAITHCVDFASICALRRQLPVADREIQLHPLAPRRSDLLSLAGAVLVHPGQSWQSKTFPKDWWDAVLKELVAGGVRPVIIGAKVDEGRSTVDVDTAGCLDVRGRFSLMEGAWLCQNASVLLTNDSSPLHMAASGDAWVGFIATAKHADYITHWRKGEWGWRQKNFGKGGIWDVLPFSPNRCQDARIDAVDPEILRSWLPEPKEFAGWAIDKQERRNAA